jgi:hypothetical protein
MATHMGYRHGHIILPLDRYLTCVRQTGRFFNGDLIHIGPVHDHRPGSIPQESNDPGLADPCLDLITKGTQFLCPIGIIVDGNFELLVGSYIRKRKGSVKKKRVQIDELN